MVYIMIAIKMTFFKNKKNTGSLRICEEIESENH